jgi:hypothetical protein
MRLITLFIALVVGVALYQSYRNDCHFGTSTWVDCMLR